MEPEEVRGLYEEYAASYDSRWYEHEKWHLEGKHHLATLRELISDSTRWLDVGCGTGYLMSHFPGVVRAGLDLTPGMLERARAANPDALELRKGDLRDDVAEWHDAWDLVSCTGQPWMYLRNLGEVERMVANLAAWTAARGTCFLPLYDFTDVTGIRLPYPELGTAPAADLPIITGVTGVFWSIFDGPSHHRHMVAPMISLWVELFARHFRRVEIHHWPKMDFVPIRRRFIVARDKRAVGDALPATIVDLAPVEEADGRLNASTQRVVPVPLYDRPLSELVRRFRPWRPAFWRAIGRRLGQLVR